MARSANLYLVKILSIWLVKGQPLTFSKVTMVIDPPLMRTLHSNKELKNKLINNMLGEIENWINKDK